MQKRVRKFGLSDALPNRKGGGIKKTASPALDQAALSDEAGIAHEPSQARKENTLPELSPTLEIEIEGKATQGGTARFEVRPEVNKELLGRANLMAQKAKVDVSIIFRQAAKQLNADLDSLAEVKPKEGITKKKVTGNPSVSLIVPTFFVEEYHRAFDPLRLGPKVAPGRAWAAFFFEKYLDATITRLEKM